MGKVNLFWGIFKHLSIHGIVKILYTNQFCKISFTQAFLSIFNVNRGKIWKIYTKINKNTHTLHDPGSRDRALIHLWFSVQQKIWQLPARYSNALLLTIETNPINHLWNIIFSFIIGDNLLHGSSSRSPQNGVRLLPPIFLSQIYMLLKRGETYIIIFNPPPKKN